VQRNKAAEAEVGLVLQICLGSLLSDEFANIRPYTDAELPGVIQRLLDDPVLVAAAANLLWPSYFANRWLTRRILQWMLRWRCRNLRSVADLQHLLSDYINALVERSSDGLSCSGLDDLPNDRPYLFVSNHRDIVLDSSLLNYLLYHQGHDTARMAVGDNLLEHPLVADFMRLNKSFIVNRSAASTRAQYRALLEVSRYVRASLQEGVSVWIAQRQGRSKDGFDRTEPAVLKMLMLAYRGDHREVAAFLEEVALIPVAVSYETDPCAVHKASELAARAETGAYEKAEQEDVNSIIDGLMGAKGQVHFHFGQPTTLSDLSEATAECMASHLDSQIVAGLKLFPTHYWAAAQLGISTDQPPVAPGDFSQQSNSTEDLNSSSSVQRLQRTLANCPADAVPYVLQQYANPIVNKQELGLL
tara:strand:+ start:25611 stop:26858 length:1248 start_codon:yes stop_codon:yes gene_type:complete